MALILETPGLLLRHLVKDDLDELFALYRDPEIRRYFPEGTLSKEETEEELEWHMHGHPRHPELGLWGTVHKETGKFIGRCGLLPWEIEFPSPDLFDRPRKHRFSKSRRAHRHDARKKGGRDRWR